MKFIARNAANLFASIGLMVIITEIWIVSVALCMREVMQHRYLSLLTSSPNYHSLEGYDNWHMIAFLNPIIKASNHYITNLEI